MNFTNEFSDKNANKNKNHEHKQIIFTGAGSGGHVITALAVIQQLEKIAPRIYNKILYIGAPNLTEGNKNNPSFEQVICKKFNIPFVKIRAGKLQRKVSSHSIGQIFGILFSFWDAFWLIKKLKPRIIVSFGGFVSLPLVFWGRLLALPCLYMNKLLISVYLISWHRFLQIKFY